MKTDRLIDVLSSNVEPVKRGRIAWIFAVALLVSAVSAFVLMLVTVGLRQNLAEVATLGLVAGKLAIASALVVAAVAYLIALARPGQRKWLRPIWMGLVALLAIVAGFAFWHATTPTETMSETEWALCLICVPLFSVIPFAALVWALRQGAPTRLRRAGMFAGLAAGGIGAAAYALHCPIDSVSFTVAWYGVAIAFCAAVGGLLGPRLLRW